MEENTKLHIHLPAFPNTDCPVKIVCRFSMENIFFFPEGHLNVSFLFVCFSYSAGKDISEISLNIKSKLISQFKGHKLYTAFRRAEKPSPLTQSYEQWIYQIETSLHNRLFKSWICKYCVLAYHQRVTADLNLLTAWTVLLGTHLCFIVRRK